MSIRSSSSTAGRSTSDSPVARKRWLSSFAKPAEVKKDPSGSQCSARALPLHVELAGRDLQQIRDADRLAWLAHEPQLIALVEHDDADRAGVDHDVAHDDRAVLVAEAHAPQGDEAAVVELFGVQRLEPGAHATAASSSSASVTSSMPSSALTETRSVGSWLCSVPLATLTVGMPAASRTLASDAPPVAMRRGS